MNHAQTLRVTCILAASLCAALLMQGCAEDSESGPTLAGIYKVDSHTINETSCEAPGPNAPQPRVMLYADIQTVIVGSFNGSFMLVQDCADLAACRTLKSGKDSSSISFSGDIFDKGNGSAGWMGSESLITQSGATNPCAATLSERTFAAIPKAADAAADAPARVRIEVRTWSTSLPPGPEDPNEIGPNCPDANLAAEAKKNPCERFEVIEATLVE